MLAGFATGGIPGSASDRSATGPATDQAEAAFDDERLGDALAVPSAASVGEALPAPALVARGVAVLAGCGDPDPKISSPATTSAATAAGTPNNSRRLARWSAGHPTLLMPILPARPSRGLHASQGSKPQGPSGPPPGRPQRA